VAKEFGMTPEEEFGFRDYIHECKDSGLKGTGNDRGDFAMDELRERAREYLGRDA
jgi:hypothetical protein